ncbi:MAG: DNA polymerase [Candidatus Odinarchaeia archaeon]
MRFNCTKCSLHKYCKGPLRGEGKIPSDIMIIGMNPGPQEEKQEKLFAHFSGSLLDKALFEAGLTRNNIYLTNIVKCYTPNAQKLTETLIQICIKEHLLKEIEAVKPKVIVALGKIANKLEPKSPLNSFYYHPNYKAWYIATYHPAYLLRRTNSKEFERFFSIFKQLKEYSQKKLPRIDLGQMILLTPSTLVNVSNILQQLRLWRKNKTKLALDLETTGIDFTKDSIICVGLSDGNVSVGIWFELLNTMREVRSLLREVFKNPLILQKGKYDSKFLKKQGYDINLSEDTMILQFQLDQQSKINLESMALKYIGTKLTKRTIDFDNIQKSDISPATWCQYVANDAWMTYKVFQCLHKQLRRKDYKFERNYYDVELNTTKLLVEMEYRGILIDKQYILQLSDKYQQVLEDIEKRINSDSRVVKFKRKQNLETLNIRSPLQMIKCFKYLKFNIDSTREEALERVYRENKDALIELLLKYRSYYKAKNTYLENFLKFMDENNRIHPNYNQCRVPTGRLSSGKPALQNIPKHGEIAKEIRRSFIASPGYLLLEADYKQMEFRIFAHYTKSKPFIDLVNSGVDVHRYIASIVFNKDMGQITGEERTIAKGTVFGLMYGRGDASVSREFEISLDEAKRIRESFFRLAPGSQSWITKVQRFAMSNGYVRTLYGRIIPLPAVYSKDKALKAGALRCAVNYPIQGAAAQTTNIAGYLLMENFKKQKLDAHVIMNIHDALIIEFNKKLENDIVNIVREVMEQRVKKLFNLLVDLKVDIKIGGHL